MSEPFRLPDGGRIDRSRRLAFTFDGRGYSGFAGDTLASALLANGVRLVARSMKYHRPRGIMTAGVEEPNALLTIGDGELATPNMKATEVALYDGLAARSQNVWPTLAYDAGAVNQWLAPLLPAGFYYKTFMASQGFWQHLAEPFIRRAAGFGQAPGRADADSYDHRHVHADVAIVGGGPAGLAAALVAARAGLRVVLADMGSGLGGSLLYRDGEIDGRPARQWLEAACQELEASPAVRLLRRTVVTGHYDQGYLVAVERRREPGLRASGRGGPAERVWHVRASRVVLATGAHERPLVFPDNDRPGVMLAGAALSYLRQHAVAVGRAPLVFTQNDTAYETAFALARSGWSRVAAIVDTRTEPTPHLLAEAEGLGIRVERAAVVVGVKGRAGVQSAEIMTLAPDGGAVRGEARAVDCDSILVSGGWSPAAHLFAHVGGKLVWDEAAHCFRPERPVTGVALAGAVNATFALADVLAEGRAAGAGTNAPAGAPGGAQGGASGPSAAPLWQVPLPRSRTKKARKAFVDLQNDTTAGDIQLAAREGYAAVEHMKRYTLTGFGTDQGKLGNVNGLAILAAATGRSIGATGHTTFRPPYVPVSFGALAGVERGDLLDPVRRTPLHAWHRAHGAVFEDVGQWKRPWYYPKSGEDMHAAVARECAAVRTAVGLLDASTLGKIDVRGPDAGRFLDMIYTGRMSNLGVGRVRYGVMCKEDGMVFDDGTVTRLAEDRFLVTTTTGGAARVLDWLEEYLQTEWPSLRVYANSLTEQLATIAVAGPKSRELLARVSRGVDLAAETFGFMTCREGEVAGVGARLMRISFSGELGFEIVLPAGSAMAVWEALMTAGKDLGITPYGTEAMHLLRAEKGYIIVGQETDGTQTPFDLGLGWLVAMAKPDFIGKRSYARDDTRREDRKQLVGLLPDDATLVLPEGAQLVETPVKLADVPRFRPPDTGGPIYVDGEPVPVPMLGHVTSSYASAALGRSFALALVKGGRQRHGQTLYAPLETRTVACRIVDPVLYDPEGKRRDG
ncbi:MAG: sarcosine oxidase subunit alpha family protein [Hyphomicrobiaceae bacterium]